MAQPGASGGLAGAFEEGIEISSQDRETTFIGRVTFRREATRAAKIVDAGHYPQGRALGLRCQHVPDGVYESQMNPVEARRVVDAAVEDLRPSLGAGPTRTCAPDATPDQPEPRAGG